MRLFVFPLCLGLLAAQHETKPGTESKVRVIRAGKGWKVDAYVSPLSDVEGTGRSDLVLDCGKSGWLSYSCSKTPCRIPVCSTQVGEATVKRVDPGASGGPASEASLSEMLRSLVRREPRIVETLGVRSGGYPNDAVVPQTGDTVNWSAALRRVLEGSYCFRLTPLPASSGGARTFALEWDQSADSAGAAQLPGLKPGTYTLEKGTPGANGSCVVNDPDAVPAWVAVVPQSNTTSWNQWKQYSEWLVGLENAGVSSATITTMRHAAIASIADSLEMK